MENRVPPLPNSKGYFGTTFLKQEFEDNNSITVGRGYLYSTLSSDPLVGQQAPPNNLKRIRNLDDFDDENNVIVKRRNLGESDFFISTPSLEEFTDPSASKFI